MTEMTFDPDRFRKTFLLILAVAISLLFFAMVREFLIAVLIAAIFTGMTHPFYRRLLALFRGRRAPASVTTILTVFFVIVVPLLGLLGIVAAQALDVSNAVGPTIRRLVAQPTELKALLGNLPFAAILEPYHDPLIAKVGDLVGTLGSFLVSALAATTRGTATFLFNLFIMLYAMFFFLIDGRALLDKILYYLPLDSENEGLMVGKFVSVSRATIKGTLIIGIVQGTLAGLAFAVVGIEAAVFWGTVMAVLSIIPGVGTALVWVPAVVYLFAIGSIGSAIGLLIWCAGVVGTVDNVLRPWLVGKDTKMPDLLILLSTLGGLFLFGAIGLIIGPIVAALFVAVWEMYGVAFKDYLPGPAPASGGGES